MLKLGIWIISPLLLMRLAAQETQILPDPSVPSPPVDMITPVPPPVIPFGAPTATAAPAFEMPKNLKIRNIGGGKISFTKDVGVRYESKIQITGDNGLQVFADGAVGDQRTNTARLDGNVRVYQKNTAADSKSPGGNQLEIFANSAVMDFNEKTITLDGNVSIYQGNTLQRGEQTVYFYERKFLDASGLRASIDPVLLEAGKFTVENRDGENVYIGEDAGITTHDVQDPNYWIRAKKTTVFPGDKIVFNDLRLYAGDTPVFWLPYLSQPLDAELGYHILPGARSNWGAFVLNTYGIMLGGDGNPGASESEKPWLLSRWHLDLRTRRGIGSGVDFVDTRLENSEEISGLSFYYLNDLSPQIPRSGIERGFVNEDRYRIELKHRLELDFPDDADWRVDANMTLLSDQHYLEDFQTDDYRINPAPDNTLGIYRQDEASLLSLYARARLNDFYRADTRTPEISFDQSRAPLFGLPILHEGNTSLGIIGEQAADPTRGAILNPLLQLSAGDPDADQFLRQLSGYDRQLAEQILKLPLNDPRRAAIRNQLLDSSYARFNTYQELSLPINNIGGFLNITPQAGLGYTYYSAVDGPVDSFDRTYLHAGTESSVKFSKDYGDFQYHPLGLDGMKHVLQPYAAWSFVSTDDFDPGDPQVDRLTPTTRPRPLDPTRFTAVDELNSWNVVRLGTRNRLLTKRDSQSYEWLYLETYMDAFINDPEGARTVSNLYNDMRWQPLPWLSVDVNTQYPIAGNGSGFNEFSGKVRFMPSQDFEFSLGYRSLNSHPVFEDSNSVNFQTYSRLNEKWGIGTRHIIELDDGTFELEQYTLHRDLGNWVAGMGLTHRDNRLRQEYGMIFSLTLKDFPTVSLPLQIDGE